MQDRINTLKKISGLPVSYYTTQCARGTVNYFVFGHKNTPIKLIATYRKAKVFAEGFAAGRSPIVAAAYPPKVTA